MSIDKDCMVTESHLRYFSGKQCVVCGNPDFERVETMTDKLLQSHRLHHVPVCGKIIVFCNSCLYDLKQKMVKEFFDEAEMQ